MGKASVTLPWPPSVNHIWRSGKGRVFKSSRYKAWRDEAWGEILAQRPAKVRGPYQAHFILTPPDNRRRDQDNYLKAANDILVACGIVKDDHLARVTTICWRDPKKPGSITVSIEAEGKS